MRETSSQSTGEEKGLKETTRATGRCEPSRRSLLRARLPANVPPRMIVRSHRGAVGDAAVARAEAAAFLSRAGTKRRRRFERDATQRPRRGPRLEGAHEPFVGVCLPEKQS